MAYQYNIGPATHTGQLCNGNCTGMWGGMNWFLPMVASSWRNGGAREYYVTVTLYTRFAGTYWSMFNGISISGVNFSNKNLNVGAANTDYELAKHNFGPYYFNTDGTPASGTLTFHGGCHIKPYTYCSGGSCGGGRTQYHQGGSVSIRHENIEPAYTAPSGLTTSHSAWNGLISIDYWLSSAGQSSSISRYELFVAKEGGGWNSSPTLTNHSSSMSGNFQYSIPNIENGKRYYYFVKAFNNHGLHTQSPTIALDPPQVPQVTIDTTSSSSKLEANARVASAGSSNVRKWVLKTKKHGQGSWATTKEVDSDQLSIRLQSDQDIEFSTVYDYEVIIYNHHGLFNTYTNISGTVSTAPQARWWLVNRKYQNGVEIKQPRIITHSNQTKSLYFIYGLHPNSLGNVKIGQAVHKSLILPKGRFSYYPGITGEILFENGQSFKVTRIGNRLVAGEFKGNTPTRLWYDDGEWATEGDIGGPGYVVKSITPNINKSVLFNAIKIKELFSR